GELHQMSQQDFNAIKQYAVGVGPDHTDLTKQNVHNLRKAGLLVHPFTVNEEADMKRLNEYGVDGVFTNYADLYMQVIAEDESNIIKIKYYALLLYYKLCPTTITCSFSSTFNTNNICC